MEAVAPEAGLVERVRQREALRHRRHGAVEGGVEAGHLGERRIELAERADGGEVVRLVQGRERDEGPKPRQHLLVDARRRVEGRPAVHHPVAHAGEDDLAERAPHQREQLGERARVAEVRTLRPVPLRHHAPVRPAGEEVRGALAGEPLDEPADVERELGPLAAIGLALGEERELDRGRARVEDQDRAGHGEGIL